MQVVEILPEGRHELYFDWVDPADNLATQGAGTSAGMSLIQFTEMVNSLNCHVNTVKPLI